jgi:ATP-dependent exoDNAse (exonuclease V) beta subunit
MSIHKAKGLEFDTVFLYWNLSGRSGNSTGNMNTYMRYTTDFSELDEFVLSYNYDHVLSKCHLNSIQQDAQRRGIVEELNNFYVAATRAKTNLFLFFSYSKAGGMEKFLDDLSKKDELSAHHIIALSMYDSLMNYYSLDLKNPYEAQSIIGQIHPMYSQDSETAETLDRDFLREYYHFDPGVYIDRDERRLQAEENLNFKSTYIKKRDADRGTIAHYYLSFIKYGTENEKRMARYRTIAHYGNLMMEQEIKDLIDKVDRFITAQQNNIFSSEKWPKVFNEFTLFGENGREVRLDRLMINEQSKQIMIIDYKTGDTYEELQIEDYRKTVEALDFVKRGGYTIDDKFMVIDIEDTL